MKKFKYSSQILVGILFLGALVLFIWGFNFLKGQEVLRSRKLVYASYPKVNGLIASNPIYLNGLQIGQVRSIYFNPDHSGNIIVELLLQNNFPIPRNSIAEIYPTSLLGSKAIQIKIGNSAQLLENGDTMVSNLDKGLFDEVSTQIIPLKNKAESLISSMDSTLLVFQSIMDLNTQANIKASFGSVRQTLGNLETTSADLSKIINHEKSNIQNIISDVASLTNTLKENEANISNTINNLSAISDTIAHANLSKSLANVNQALNDFSGILNDVHQGKGSLGQLVENDSLYLELQHSVTNMKLLLEDIKKNPKRYVKFSLF